MRDPQHDGADFNVVVETVHLADMVHRATTVVEEGKSFTFYSDEGADIGGEDTNPYPLDYLAASIGL